MCYWSYTSVYLIIFFTRGKIKMEGTLFLPNPQLLWEIKSNKAVIYLPDKEIGLDREGTDIFFQIIRRQPIIATTTEQEEFIEELMEYNVIMPYDPINPKFFPPGAIAVEITHRCNLKCEHCYVGTRNNPATLSLEVIKKLIHDMEKLGCYQLAIGGGEPTLHPNFEKILEIIHKSKIFAHIVTNGTTNLSEYLEKYANKKKRSFEVTISIDGPKEIHEKVRKSVKFEEIINNIKKLAELGWKPQIQTTVSLKTYKYIPKLLKELKDLPISAWAVKMEYPVGNARSHANIFPSSTEFVKMTSEIWEWWEESNLKRIEFVEDLGYFPPAIKKPAKKRAYYLCSAGVTQVTIDAEGNITPCTLIQITDGSTKYIAGNLYYDSLIEVWHTSNVLWEFRLMWPENESCARCGLVCAKCPATVLGIKGDIRKPDPRCPLQ
uniref:Heme biosynthesis protein related n=1 Tax=Pyrococcus abyssi (strain GE5 / Orsay) TaxID=272844 RepID=G8ZIG9_PYRAB|nr:TPA: heme biosynthesis protein related [Pyrococcus abyssi GE5]